jgi:hypothetical protein
MVRLIWDHFDREISRFRFGLLRTAAYLSLFVVEGGAAFFNIKMISWHRFKKPLFPDRTNLAGATRATEGTRKCGLRSLAARSCALAHPSRTRAAIMLPALPVAFFVSRSSGIQTYRTLTAGAAWARVDTPTVSLSVQKLPQSKIGQ